jgi:hypothetical protein
MEKAYLLSADETFGRFLEAFAEEVDTYLDDRRLGQVDPGDPASMTWKELEDLEASMSLKPNKRKASK